MANIIPKFISAEKKSFTNGIEEFFNPWNIFILAVDWISFEVCPVSL